MRGVDGERCEHREDAFLEHGVEMLAVGGVEVVPAREADARLLERGCDLLGEHGRLAGHELVDARVRIALQLLDLVETVGRR